MTTATLNRQTRLNIRATEDQKATIAHAARLKHSTISEFVLNRACRDAEEILADQNDFPLPARQWSEFNQALDAPPQPVQALRQLLAERGVFDA
jgi:uncharacterized protein (DUF1778 family)